MKSSNVIRQFLNRIAFGTAPSIRRRMGITFISVLMMTCELHSSVVLTNQDFETSPSAWTFQDGSGGFGGITNSEAFTGVQSLFASKTNLAPSTTVTFQRINPTTDIEMYFRTHFKITSLVRNGVSDCQRHLKSPENRRDIFPFSWGGFSSTSCR